MNRVSNANGEVTSITSDEAKLIIEQEKKNRISACQEEINAVLEKYNCNFDVIVILHQGQVTQQIGIIAK